MAQKSRKKLKPLSKMTAAERRAFLQKESMTGGRANLRGFTPKFGQSSKIKLSGSSTPTNQSWGSKAQKAALAKAQKASAAARRKFKSFTGKSKTTFSGR